MQETVEWTAALTGADYEFSGSACSEDLSFTPDEGSCFLAGLMMKVRVLTYQRNR
jgi:hypothetical protein